MTIDFTQILLWILEALAGAFMTYFFPKINKLVQAKIDSVQMENAVKQANKTFTDIDKFVDAAEQLAKKQNLGGDWKNNYVLNLLQSNGCDIDDTIKAYVEASVYGLDKTSEE